MELNKIITGLLLIILIVSGIVVFLAGATSQYAATTADYNSSSLVLIQNKTARIYNLTERANDELTSLQSETSEGGVTFFSAIDTFLTQGYYGIVIAAQSAGVAGEIVTVGVAETSEITGGYSGQISGILIAIITVIVSIGIIAAVLLTKAQRL